MNDNDKKEFAKIIMAMGENFNATVTKEGLQIRFEALKEFSINQVKQACIELVKTRVYPGMPVAGEIRAAISSGPGGNNPKKIEDVAQAGLNEIMGQIRAVGSYGAPKWNDPIVADLLSRRWSWRGLCEMTETEHKWFAKEFVEAYRAAATNGDSAPVRIEAGARVLRLVEGIGNIGKKTA